MSAGIAGYCRSGREPLCAEQVFLGDTRLNGGYAEYVAVDADNVAPVPDDVALDAAAIASCAIGTMLHAVRTVGRVAPGDRVMVTGAGGGLGVHGVQLAKRAGGWVIAQTTSAAKAEALKEYGVDAVVVASRDGDFSADVKAVTDGEGVDCVLDTVGTPVFTPTRRSVGAWRTVGADRTTGWRIRAVQSGAALPQRHLHAERHRHDARRAAALPGRAAARWHTRGARPMLSAGTSGRGFGAGAVRRRDRTCRPVRRGLTVARLNHCLRGVRVLDLSSYLLDRSPVFSSPISVLRAED